MIRLTKIRFQIGFWNLLFAIFRLVTVSVTLSDKNHEICGGPIRGVVQLDIGPISAPLLYNSDLHGSKNDSCGAQRGFGSQSVNIT